MTISRNISVMAQGASTAGVLNASYGGSLAWQSVQTGNFTAVAGNAYPVNTTSSAVTVTLPASPTAGQIVQLTDYAGTWATNNVTVAPNGSKINGGSGSFSATSNRESIAFVYIDATQGWVPYSGITASSFSQYTASYLIVAGGGGGGSDAAGGGGAGGLLSGTATVTSGTVYSFTVGAGGATATSGSNSVGLSQTAIGGGKGSASNGNGTAGGSGGGAGWSSGSAYTGGAGTSGQGFAGGGAGASASPGLGGGGGGSSAVGTAGRPSGNGNGGAGTASSITGASVTYAGGGGGGGYNGAPGSGGSGGGGAGGRVNDPGTVISVAVAGTANTGSGGGGGGAYSQSGAAGGSGVVILSVPTAFYSGTTTGSPTVTTSGSNTIIKFTSSGSYTA